MMNISVLIFSLLGFLSLQAKSMEPVECLSVDGRTSFTYDMQDGKPVIIRVSNLLTGGLVGAHLDLQPAALPYEDNGLVSPKIPPFGNSGNLHTGGMVGLYLDNVLFLCPSK